MRHGPVASHGNELRALRHPWTHHHARRSDPGMARHLPIGRRAPRPRPPVARRSARRARSPRSSPHPRHRGHTHGGNRRRRNRRRRRGPDPKEFDMKDTEIEATDREHLEVTIAAGIDRLMSVSADRVYREPVRVGDRVVIPAATIAYGGGFGFGSGGDEVERGGGGGGGGWNDGRPVAVIEASPDGVR